MAKLEIIYRAVGGLRPRATNSRTHTRKQLEQIAASIQRFGFTNPVLIDEEDGIIAGHGRVEAAKLIGIAEVPTVRLTGILHLAPRGFELHVDDGGIWALDISSWRRTRNMVGQRVTVVGTRSGFDLLDVHEIWTAPQTQLISRS